MIEQFTNIATNQHYAKFAGKDGQASTTTTPNDNDEILIEYEDADEHALFSARPALVDDDTDEKFEEILQSAYNADLAPLTVQTDLATPRSPEPSIDNYLSTSSMEDSIKIYNVQTGEIVKCKPQDKLSPRYDGPDCSETPDNDLSEEAELSQSDVAAEATAEADDVRTLGDSICKISDIEEILPQLPKVKELAKKFLSMENLNEPIKVGIQYHFSIN